MKNFQKTIGKSTVLTVHNNVCSIVQHSPSGMQQIKLPITSLLQAVSDLVLHDLDSTSPEDEAIFLATPYINRALQTGSSCMTSIRNAEVSMVIASLRHHPLAGVMNFVAVESSRDGYSDIVIATKGV